MAENVDKGGGVNSDVDKVKVDRSAYYREYMRVRREAKKLAEAREENVVVDGGVGVEWDKAKYPVRAAWEIAVGRAERARRYAKKFPHLVHSDDLRFQDLGWQYENEGLKAVSGKRV